VQYEHLIIKNKNKNKKTNKNNNQQSTIQSTMSISNQSQNGPKMMLALGLRQFDSGDNTILCNFNAQSTATGQHGLTGNHTTLGFVAHDVQSTRIQLFCWPNYLLAPQPAILYGKEWDKSDIYEFQQIIINSPARQDCCRDFGTHCPMCWR
jgi:hypothetical protein